MLADTGGNTGSQAATVVVRALALKEISAADAFRVLAKELGVALLLGLVLGVLATGRVLLFTRGAELPLGMRVYDLALAVSLALSLQVVSSTVIGAALPLAAAKLKIDPALVASPMLTTVVDITGLLLYFSIAKVLLGGFLG
jgi:magnesium transporter